MPKALGPVLNLDPAYDDASEDGGAPYFARIDCAMEAADDPFVLLNLDPAYDDASEEGARQLKRAKNVYRRAHPDKHRDDPEADAKFVALQSAYEIVSDPSLRLAHSVGGAKAVKMMKAAGPEQRELLTTVFRAVPLLKSGRISAVVAALLCVVTCLIMPLLFAGLVVIALKSDGVGKLTELSWALVLTPLWIVDALLLVAALFLLVGGSWCHVRLCQRAERKAKEEAAKHAAEEEDGEIGRGWRSGAGCDTGGKDKDARTCGESCALGSMVWLEWCLVPVVELALIVALEVMLALRADGVLRARSGTRTRWAVVLAPWLALESLGVARACFRSDVHFSCGAARVKCRSGGAGSGGATARALLGVAATALRYAYPAALRLGTAALITLKLERTFVALRWSVVFIPLWAWAALELGCACTGPAAERCASPAATPAATPLAAGGSESGEAAAVRKAQEEAEAAEKDLKCLLCCGTSCVNIARLVFWTGPVAVLTLLLALRIDNVFARLSFVWILVPILLPLLLCACVSSVFSVAIPLILWRLPELWKAASEAVTKASSTRGGEGDAYGSSAFTPPAEAV